MTILQIGGFCLLVKLHTDGLAINRATQSSFNGCQQPKSGYIPSIPFSYQFEVKRGFQKQIRLYEQEICLCELKSVIETQIYM